MNRTHLICNFAVFFSILFQIILTNSINFSPALFTNFTVSIMVHCIHKNNQTNKKKDNYLDIEVNEDLQQEMMLLSTKDDENTSGSAINSNSFKNSNNKTSNVQDKKLKSDAFSVLSYDQVKRLHKVIQQIVPIHGKGNFPTLDVKLKDLVKIVRTKLETEQSIKVSDIRLNGGAASFCLLPDNSNYNDLDLIFAVDLSDNETYNKIRTAVLDSLLEFLPEGVNKDRISQTSLKDAYIHKMVKVNEKDRWSLISLSNNNGRNVELKFVDKMKRQYEFSVDSFHIILDSLMLFYECSKMPISENIYPTVLAESVYGDFNQAFSHLENKLIATRSPEMIRGGGLLKYCNLLIRNYTPESVEEIKNLERYMCSRFFIDFSELPQQKAKLESYLTNHFNGDDCTKAKYLMQLYSIVSNSTVCLMGHEFRSSLSLIEEMAYHFYLRSQQTTPHNYQFNFPFSTHYNAKQNQQTQFYSPHVHHHLIARPHHTHYDHLVTAVSQQQQTNSKQQSNQTNNNQNSAASKNSSKNSLTTTSSSVTSATNSTGTNNLTTNATNNSSSSNNAQQSIHSNSHSSTNNCKNSTKNQQQNLTSNQSQQHVQQQQYHAYLFGSGANTFYYSPYHHHHNYHQANNGCINSLGCRCGGVWIGCA